MMKMKYLPQTAEDLAIIVRAKWRGRDYSLLHMRHGDRRDAKIVRRMIAYKKLWPEMYVHARNNTMLEWYDIDSGLWDNYEAPAGAVQRPIRGAFHVYEDVSGFIVAGSVCDRPEYSRSPRDWLENNWDKT